MTTKYEAAEELGLKVYDMALPQGWIDDLAEVTGEYVPQLFVWCYDRVKIGGEPVPLTIHGAQLLSVYNRVRGTFYGELP